MATSARGMVLGEPTTVSVLSLLRRIDGLDPSSKEAVELINSLLSFAQGLASQDAQELIDGLDRKLDSVEARTDFFRRCLRSLRSICGLKRLVPSSHLLSEGLKRNNETPTAWGAFGDVWDGTFNGKRVAIKELRTSIDNLERVRKTFCEEVVVWRRSSHQNIVPFLGISMNLPRLYMVSKWMIHGNLSQYLRSNPKGNRLQLISDIVGGLEFLHSSGIVHGDLKAANILINEAEHACLADFGLTSIRSNPDTFKAQISTFGPAGTAQWMAPELFDIDDLGPPNSLPSAASDVYAFSMVVIEMFTGRVPFPNQNAFTHALKVAKGERPARPMEATELGLSDGVWELIQDCWHSQKDKRPAASSVMTRLWKISPELSLLNRLAWFNSTSETSMGVLQSILDSSAYLSFALRLHGQDALTLIDILDHAMDSPHADRIFIGKCQCVLIETCSQTGLLPSSYMLSSGLTKDNDIPNTSRGFVEVWQGTYQARQVAITSFRASRFQKEFCKRAVIIKRSSHPNVVPILGVSAEFSPMMSLVSEWMPHRTLSGYLDRHPRADRIRLAKAIATGLQYLHSFNIIHGYLRGSNILVDGTGQARLSGFELAFYDPTTLPLSTTAAFGIIRWMAPELFDIDGPGESGPTTASDIYALGMVLLETLTGTIPFDNYGSEAAVIIRVLRGIRPKRPDSGSESEWINDRMWALIEMCWKQNPEDRPSASFVLDYLGETPPTAPSGSPAE